MRLCRQFLVNVLAMFLVLTATAQIHGKATGKVEFNVLDFGAIGDGKTLNTKAIQAAIDSCNAAGGGRVVFPRGIFLTGTIRLKSHVTLMIGSETRLLGSTHLIDYPKDAGVSNWQSRLNNNLCGSLIYSEKATDIAIEGYGIIDGSQRIAPGGPEQFPFPNRDDPESRRPTLVQLCECVNIRIKDVTLKDPPSFSTFLVGCRDILIDGVQVRSNETPNGDGLDFDGCERVRISNCDLNTGDDAIGLKTLQPNKPNRDFVISNCVISSKWAAVRLGPESFADMRNIAISNCIFQSCRDGFKIQSCEGKAIEGVVISNIIMDNVLRPFFITLNTFSMSKYASPGLPLVGKLRDLHVSNIRAYVPNNQTGDVYDQPCFALVGVPDQSIENVTFSDLSLSMPGGGTPEDAKRMNIPELLSEQLYPEAFQFGGELPASGIYLRHVSGVVFNQCRIETVKPDARAFFAGDGLEDVSLTGVTGIGFESVPGLVKFANSKDVTLTNCRVRIKGKPGNASFYKDHTTTDRPLFVGVTTEEKTKLANFRRK